MSENNSSVVYEPPYTNRGAQNTLDTHLTACVDWFSCTFHEVNSLYEVIRILGLQGNETDFKDLPRGNYGYKSISVYQGIKIMYNGAANMGIHVEMSGSACRTFEKYSNLEWKDLFWRVTQKNNFDPKIIYPHEGYSKENITSDNFSFVANITRLDLALDDYRGYFKIPNLIKYLRNGQVTSLFRIAKRINNIVIATGEEIGYTLYFGKPTSRIQVRFYEKNIEQQMKGKEIPEGAEIWNRTEIQARDERAHAFAELIATTNIPMGMIICGTLKNYIAFRRKGYVNGKKSNDTNKSRWDLADFWIKFLSDAEKVRLTTKPLPVTIERKYSWIDKAVTKTLAMLSFAFPEDSSYMIENFVKEGYEKIEDADWDLIDDFKKKKVSLDDFILDIKKANPKNRN